MGRRVLIGALIVVVAVGIGAAVAYVTRDDDSSDSTTRPTTTTGASTTTTLTTTTTPPTTAPTTTTLASGALPDPCGAETATIRLAIDSGVEGATDGADIDTCRLAAVDTSWALVQLVPKAGSGFAPVSVLLQGGGGSWSIVDQGGANLGCGRAPQQVLADLGLFCTSTGGGEE
jgi:hypothetical protein